MALAILDGTQTATTLSTILSSGQHITAHTVVSLGTQAKTDILSAVSSGIAITGTVTVGVLPALTNNTDFVGVGENILEGFQNQGTVPVEFDTQNLAQGLAGLQVQATCVTSTNRIGVVTIGAGTVTIGAGTAQIGSVTVGNSVTIGSLPAISGTVTANNNTIDNFFGLSLEEVGEQDATFAVRVQGSSLSPLPISGTVTASLAISATAITSGSFASLTSATLVPGNTARKMATVFNQGAGQLFVNAGVTATTAAGGFMVALSSGDYFECGFTTTTLSALFASAGTASWVSH